MTAVVDSRRDETQDQADDSAHLNETTVRHAAQRNETHQLDDLENAGHAAEIDQLAGDSFRSRFDVHRRSTVVREE